MPSANAPSRRAERSLHGLDRPKALRHLVGDEVDDGFGVGIGLEHMTLGGQLGFEVAIVLDDAVVHHRHRPAHVRMRVALGRPAVGRPARVADAGAALQRLGDQACLEVAQLALGAPAFEVAVLDGRDAG